MIEGADAATDPSADAATDPSSDHRSAGWWVAAVAIALTLLATIVLQLVVRSDLWLDEALSVNIAKIPLGDLHGALKRDGAPPLYYVLLHYWIDAFGAGDVAVRALSGVLTVATYPAMYFAGRRLAGRRGAWTAVLVFATSPYVFRYATETRMYALVMFLVAWGYLALLRAFERPSLGRLAVVTAVVAALLYTHNWSYYLVATVGIVVVLRGWKGPTADGRRAAWRVLGAIVVGGLLYVPWLPTVRYQIAHTGTPWGDARLPWSGLVEFVGDLGAIGVPEHGELFVYVAILMALLLLGLFGAAVDRRHIDLDLHTRPAVRWEVVVGLGAVLLGLSLSFVGGTAFDGRYGAIGVPLLLLAVTMGVLAFAGPRVRIAVLVVVVLLGLAGGVRNARDQRTQAGEVAAVLEAEARPGDLVVYCPDQLGPSVHRLLGDDLGLTEVTYPALGGPERVNWVDYRDRIDTTDSDAFARRVLEKADGARIWYVVSPGYRSVEGRCEEVGAALATARPGFAPRVLPDDDLNFEFMGLNEYPAS